MLRDGEKRGEAVGLFGEHFGNLVLSDFKVRGIFRAGMEGKGDPAGNPCAGGGGLFAERWSRYLIDNLPESPIMSANQLDSWLEETGPIYSHMGQRDLRKEVQ